MNDKLLNIISGALQGIATTATLALREIDAYRTEQAARHEAVTPTEPALPAIAGRPRP